MASSVIHMAVCNEINKKLKRNNSKILIGTIAADISKLVGETKYYSHFLDDSYDIPNLYKFLTKYKYNLDDDFVLGYYIHLYTDYLWFKYFVTDFLNEDMITKLDGTIINCHGNMAINYIYNDYTNLNIQIIDEYNLDLKIFYNEIPVFNNIIEEISIDKLYLIINKTEQIIENSKQTKELVFNMENINKFISLCVDIISSDLRSLGVL